MYTIRYMNITINRKWWWLIINPPPNQVNFFIVVVLEVGTPMTINIRRNVS